MNMRERLRRLRRRLAPGASIGWALISLGLLTHAGAVAVGNVGAHWGTFTATREGSCGRGGCSFDGTWVGDDGARMTFAEMQKGGLAPGLSARAARPSVPSPLDPSAVYSPWRLRLEPLMFGLVGLLLGGIARSSWRERDWPADFDGGRHHPADYRPRHRIGAARAAATPDGPQPHAQSGDSPSSR